MNAQKRCLILSDYRQIVLAIPNFKSPKNKKYWTVDFAYKCLPMKFSLQALLEEVNAFPIKGLTP